MFKKKNGILILPVQARPLSRQSRKTAVNTSFDTCETSPKTRTSITLDRYNNNNNGICKAPTLRLKALNKHSITHNVQRDGNVISNKNVNKEKRKKAKT